MHAHLSVGADVGQAAAITDVTALDDPNLANRRSNVRRELIGSDAQNAVETRASSYFVKYAGYSIFCVCRH
jgi:hypothetical protein